MSSFEDRDGWIWMDGEFKPWREAHIHVLTHGLHYASTVFEGERCYQGKIFKSREHAARLINSADILGMSFPYTVDEIEQAKYDTLKKNGLEEAYVRAVAWRGGEQMGIGAQQTLTHMAVAAWEWPSYFSAELREKGISLITSPWRKPSPETAPVHSKASGLYMIGTMSKHWAEQKGYIDALMLDYRGHVVESTGTNLFMVENGILITPPPDCFLNGITRQTVLQLAKDANISVEESFILPEDLARAEEVFLTGTAAEVTAVGQIDDIYYTVGPVTRQIRELYEKLVRS